MERVAIAIVGCGNFGSHMARLIQELEPFRIAGCYDSDWAGADSLAAGLETSTYESFSDCLSDPRLDAVFLATPNHLHCPQAVAAARAGKHIFCEKPMALDVQECHQMMEAATAAGVKLMVGHKRRLRPQYAKMSQVVRSGRFGRVMAVNINGFYHRDWWSWWLRRDRGGGLLHASGVHDIDFLRHICGEAGNVFARSPVKTDHRSDFEDQISMLIHFESGAVATLQVSPFSPIRTFRQSFGVHIVLEQGGILYDPGDCSVTIRSRDGWEERHRFDNEAGFRSAYVQELTSFADWILEGREPVLTGWDGLRCVEIMEAAYLSARTGRQVELPLPRRNAPAIIRGPLSRRRDLEEPTLFARGLSMPEGPAFDAGGNLFVANCRADHVSRISPAGRVSRFLTTGGKPQGVVVDPDGSLLISDHKLRKILRAGPDGSLEDFCTHYGDGRRLRGPNEILLGPGGQVYFTDPGTAWRGRRTGAVSRVTEQGFAELLADGLEFTNGLDFHPCGMTIFVVETTSGKILRAPLDESGALAGPLEEFIRFPGRVGPDGIRFAADGDLYVTLFGRGQIAVVSPGAEVIDRIRLPGLYPTNAVFRDGNLLVCEGATGAIWSLALGVEGLPSYSERVWNGV